MPEGNRIDHKQESIAAAEKKHELPIALRGGIVLMRKAALRQRWMKPNPGEMEIVELGGPSGGTSYSVGDSTVKVLPGEYTVYQLRVERTVMPNAWAKSIRETSRLPFKSRIVLEGWDDELAGKDVIDADGKMIDRVSGWVDDLDGEGRTLDQWAADVFESANFEGIRFGFVDNDPRQFPDPESRRRAGARPYCTEIDRKALLHLIVGKAPGGAKRVLQLAFFQPIGEPDIVDPNDWTEGTQLSIKVVTAGDPLAEKGSDERKVRVRVYIEPEKANGEWSELVDERTTIEPDNPQEELVDIPFVPFYGKRTGPWTGECPYLNSAETQVGVMNHSSELLNKTRESALSYLHESGVALDQKRGSKPVRPDTTNFRYRYSSKESAKLTLVESDGQALKAIREIVEWLVEAINAEHHQIDSDKPGGAVTAREITLRGVHASSDLEMRVIMHEAGWRKVLELMALLGGHVQTGTATIPHDFGLPNTGMERNESLFLSGKMTAKNYWGEALRSGDVDEKKFDLEAEIDLEAESLRNESVSNGATSIERGLLETELDDDGEDS